MSSTLGWTLALPTLVSSSLASNCSRRFLCHSGPASSPSPGPLALLHLWGTGPLHSCSLSETSFPRWRLPGLPGPSPASDTTLAVPATCALATAWSSASSSPAVACPWRAHNRRGLQGGGSALSLATLPVPGDGVRGPGPPGSCCGHQAELLWVYPPPAFCPQGGMPGCVRLRSSHRAGEGGDEDAGPGAALVARGGPEPSRAPRSQVAR